MPRQRLARSRTLLILGVAAVVVLGDLSSKAWARHALSAHARHVWGPWWWRLQYNRGVSFSLNPSGPRWTSLVTLVVLALLVPFARRAASTWSSVGFGLVFGGGVGNLIDRVTATPPRVTDFVAVGSFPVFNLADAAITVGVVSIIIAAWRAQSIVHP
ncbi:MAG TPA: signal peptidase II [Acidimicrobiales bacterium]|nr:signal peptidase II [Acidimicrobiales bacterium]